MVDEYSGLWAEDDPKEKAKRKAAEKEYFDEIEVHRLPCYKEVQEHLESLSTKKAKATYIADILLRYKNYPDFIHQANAKYKAKWVRDNMNRAVSFYEEHAEQMGHAQLETEAIVAEYHRIKTYFASSNIGLIPGKILWLGENRHIQIDRLIQEWTSSVPTTIYLDHEGVEQYINKRFVLGKAQTADPGDFIIWNDTNEKLLWWIICLVEEKLLNVEVSTGRLVIDTDSDGNYIYERDAVPKIVAFAANHFLKYRDGGIEFFSSGSLDSIYHKVRANLDSSKSKLMTEKPDLYSILSTVQEIAALLDPGDIVEVPTSPN